VTAAMKIIELQAENVKRLRAVTITPEGNIVEISGRNGQGKTSVLDAIWWAVSGTTHIQAVPIRKGEN
jgi:recombinational DNA repair ATPase RecF